MRFPSYYVIIACIAFSAVGCSSDGASPGNPDAGPIDAPLHQNAPTFLVFSTNITEVSDFDSVRFSAVLSDPDGIDDLIGGVLKSEDGDISYGAFVTAGQEGSYSLDLSWWEFDKEADLTFRNEQNRVFVAEFFDVAGHVARASVTLRFFCYDDGFDYDVCAGDCSGFDWSPDHCGECGNQCPDGTFCTQGRCGKEQRNQVFRGTCTDFCASVAMECAPLCGETDSPSLSLDGLSAFWGGDYASVQAHVNGIREYNADCDYVPPVENNAGNQWLWSTCCCVVP